MTDPDEIKKAERRAYSRGYAAGLKRSAMTLRARQDAIKAAEKRGYELGLQEGAKSTHPMLAPRLEAGAPYPCYFNCGSWLASKFDSKAFKGWAWFCEYGEGPVHFCPQCRVTRADDIEEIRKKLSIRPANYPAERAKP